MNIEYLTDIILLLSAAVAELARAALLNMDAEEPEVAVALEHFRSHYYGRINKDG